MIATSRALVLPAVRDAGEAPLSSPWPYRALLAFTFVLVISPQQLVPALAVVRPALLTASLAAASYLAHCLARGKAPATMTAETRLAIALAVWGLLTVPFSIWPAGSLGVLAGLFVKSLVVFWLLANVIDRPEAMRGMFLCLTLLAIPLAATAIGHFVSGDYTAGGDPGMRRIVGYEAPLTANPNDLALTLNLILPLTLALIPHAGTPLRRLTLAAIAVLEAVAVVLTFSRGGFLTLAAIGTLLAKRSGRGLLVALAAAAGAIVLLAAPAVLPDGYLDRLSTITHIDSDATGSAQERWRDMGVAAEYALSHPLVGAGLGMNVLALNEARGARWGMVHDVYLQVAMDLALPGLVLYLLLLRAAGKSAREARRLCGDDPGGPEIAAYAGGIELGLAGFAVAAIFHPVAYHFYFFLLAGFAVACRTIASRWRPSREAA